MPNAKLLNRLGLPAALVAAVANDSYHRGESHISVTGLIAPAYQRWLRETVEVQEDVADRIWATFGQSMHLLLERAHDGSDGTAEQRLYAEMLGWRVSGQYDIYTKSDRTIWDYKVTTVWSRLGKPEWEQQLNFLRVLAHANDMPVDKLKIVAIYRDWVKAKAFDDSYPSQQVEVLDIPVWELEIARARMEARIQAHQKNPPDPCSDEERWKAEDVFALKKEGRKSAVKLYASMAEAQAAADEAGKGHFVETRAGGYRRCEGYCNVSHACPVWQAEVPF